MRKRIGALGLAAVLLLAMICPALAAGTKFIVKGPEQAPRKGETFTVTVELEGNPGFAGFGFTLSFDKEKVSCVEAVEGKLLTDNGMTAVTNPDAKDGARIVCASADDVSGNGEIGRFVLVAKEDLTKVDLSLSKVKISDANRNAIAFDIEVNGMNQSDTPTSEPDPTTVRPAPNPDPGPKSEPQPSQEPEPSPEPAPESESVQEITFTDTKRHWAESYISRAAELGLFKGYEDGSFKPDVDVTRAQYVTVLFRMAGSPAVSTEAPFTDIASQNQEFRTAIAWGYENGYLNGRSEEIFDPTGPVTRQEAMKILFGYDGGVSGTEAMFTATYDSTYTDSDQLASWGKPAMYWGVYKSIITGTSETTLSPNGTATRAQLAKILTVYYDQQNKS